MVIKKCIALNLFLTSTKSKYYGKRIQNYSARKVSANFF